MWCLDFFCESTFATTTFPENHVKFQVLLCQHLPRKRVGVSRSFFVHPATRSFPANHVAFQFCFCVNLHTLTLLKEKCRFSSFFLSTCAPLTLPNNHVTFHCFMVVGLTPPEPSQHTMCCFKFLLALQSRSLPEPKLQLE